MQNCNRHILEALDLARKLIILSDEGEADAKDDSCTLLYGIVRDCAYKIRKLAESELESHKVKGMWD